MVGWWQITEGLDRLPLHLPSMYQTDVYNSDNDPLLKTAFWTASVAVDFVFWSLFQGCDNLPCSLSVALAMDKINMFIMLSEHNIVALPFPNISLY